jgi:hypothetical protein
MKEILNILHKQNISLDIIPAIPIIVSEEWIICSIFCSRQQEQPNTPGWKINMFLSLLKLPPI